MSIPSGGGLPKGISLSNTTHSEVATCLPLPSLPVFCGALDEDLRLANEGAGSSIRKSSGVNVSAQIADLLRNADVSYLNLKDEASLNRGGSEGNSNLLNEVIRHNPNAFELVAPGLAKETMYSGNVTESKLFDQNKFIINEAQGDQQVNKDFLQDDTAKNDVASSSRKSKVKKKGKFDYAAATCSDSRERQDAAVSSFCDFLENLCGRAEIYSDDRDEAEWVALSHADLRALVNEIMSIRSKKFLHMVPVDTLSKMLKVLDQQIHRAEGLSIDDCESSESDVVSSIYCSLESIHAALAIMVHDGMPKQLYKEENIERILEFSRHQVMDVIFASDPAYRALHKPKLEETLYDEEDEEFEDFESSSKRRRTSKGIRDKKSTKNKMSGTVNVILQKLCTILSFLKQLLMIERLSDSCILQLVRTSLQTILVDNIQLLQLKAISLIGGIYYTYTQHRSYVMDETLQVLLKLPLTKRVPRTYHLPDEEHRQIQLISALLIQMVHYSANLPEILKQTSETPSLDLPIDSDYPSKCLQAVTESCCLFWTRVLERYASTKNQDASELKAVMENIIMDLLTTLNLPEYPASAHILEVLCVLLLQNAGLKSKDVSARAMAIELLGTIASRLKRDSLICKKEEFWIVQELMNSSSDDLNYSRDACTVCSKSLNERSMFVCQGCQRPFHIDCMGGREQDVSSRNSDCQICIVEKQLLSLKTYSESQIKDGKKKIRNHSGKSSENPATITTQEIIQQMILNYLQEAGSADELHLFTRWFYLCIWYKDDPVSQNKHLYYLARLKSRAIMRDSCFFPSFLTRDSVKKISLALGQKCSFARGFDNILRLLLASLRENSSGIRSKALRAVSFIVEADPEVLGDNLVQTAVEGRFCDSHISVREAALEIVGRHIASHPDVGLKYFEKVAERIKDTGVSVRKRAIKIIKEMCTSSDDFPQHTNACIEIISRVNEEESSIQDLVCKTFYEFWFEEPSDVQIRSFKDGSCVPLELAKKTEQIVEMLKRMSTHQPLVIVIRRNLALDFFPQATKAAGINPVLLASVRKRCELICKCLLEKILQVAETNSEDGEGHMLPYFMLLHAFCIVDPTLCAPASDPSQFVLTLQPYLKSQSDNRRAAQLLESILFIIDSVLPLLRKVPMNIVEELEQDLKHMIVRHSFLTVVHACIKCLCSAGKVAGKGATVVEYLVLLFCKRLNALGFNNKQQVERCLFCLGLLIRYGSSLLDSSASNTKNMDVLSSINLFKRYLQAENFDIKVRALQALGNVTIARPECMLQKDVSEILEATLSPTVDSNLKVQSLQNMYEYLLDAESQMEPDKANKDEVNSSSNGVHNVPVAAGAGDTNICGGIVLLYWKSILGRSLDVNDVVRQTALKIVEIVLRQGLVHPQSCVPYLIALETDPLEANSKLAHHLLMNLNDKYPTFFEGCLAEGLQKSFIFIHTMSGVNPEENLRFPNNMKGKSDSGSSAYARLGVSRIYKLTRGNRPARNRFMSSVIRKFEMSSWSDVVIPFLTYCTEILALLPFTSPDEPLYLIYSINRVVQVRAGIIESRMKDLLHLVQASSQKYNGNGNQLDQAPNPFSERTVTFDGNHEIRGEFQGQDQDLPGNTSVNDTDQVTPKDKFSISASDVQKIQGDFIAASSVQLLLRLKRHLKIVYSLDDARCQAFNPTEPPKPGETLSRQSIPFNVSDININPPNSYDDLVKRYQELKNALKEDTVDYSTFTANIKRKRPTPQKITPQKATPQRRGGKAVRMQAIAEDEDDDDDDEDWGNGGVKRSSRNSPQVASSRRTRQRP